ncbi:MAG: hypothetical protein HQK88_08630 [Nitrospirae bacterium]|nr:hypothetical protein [Nitrospirota bacterium]MBF0535346.1 hypothetical protein [Nitrospirota bacterium]MBF0616867.1 hypothetical protein [Nitrospirota bacterium]
MGDNKISIIKSIVFLLIFGIILLLSKHIELNAETNPRDFINTTTTTAFGISPGDSTTTTAIALSTTTTTTAIALSTTTTTAIALSTTTATTTTSIPTDFSKTITYFLPYLHTNTNNVVYCEVSNNSTSNGALGVLTVLSNSGTNKPSQTNEPTGFPITAKQTAMITFSGASVTLGGTTVDITTNTDNTGANSSQVYYSAKIAFGTYDSTATCDTIGMTCFQGTTSPKRNLIGYLCFDTIYYAH